MNLNDQFEVLGMLRGMVEAIGKPVSEWSDAQATRLRELLSLLPPQFIVYLRKHSYPSAYIFIEEIVTELYPEEMGK